MANTDKLSVWVFVGSGGRFPSGVFSDKDIAEIWIKSNSLTGVLTRYPIDISVYEWAQVSGFFTPKKASEREAQFIQKFSSASQEHYHYEDGIRDE